MPTRQTTNKRLEEARGRAAAYLERAERAERDERRTREESGRYDAALDGLMRDVAAQLADPFCHPTSIASARLIAALERASKTVHSR
jgi:hypothetical protein